MHGDGLTPHANALGAADEAWASGKVGSRQVYVGVLDEGIQITHPDLDANIWTNPFDPVNGVDDDGNGYVDDINGWDFYNGDRSVFDGGESHGTHVAGTIGAEGGNGVGVAGVNWRVTMIPVKFLGSGVTFASDAVAAVDYLTDLAERHGLRIVALNASWGGDPDGSERSLGDAIARAGDAGILSVAAAGNGAADNDADPTYPSATTCTTRADTGAPRGFDCVVSVAATDRTGSLASFSNYGEAGVDLGAPGVDVYSTVPSNGYGRKSGTSMSAPHVTGAIALCASIGPGLGARELRAAVVSSVASTSSLVGVTTTGGRLDVGALVDACTPSTGAVTGGATGLAASAVGPSSLRLDWGDGAAHEQTWQIQAARDADCGAPTWSPAGEIGTGQGRLFVEGLAPDAPYCFRVRAVNGYGGGSAGAWEVLGPVRTAPALTPYTCAPATYTWLDATTGARRTLPDDGSTEVGIGFTFRLYGTPFTKVRVTSNGVLVFGSGSAERFVNTPIPATIDPDGLAAGFWDDLDPSKGGSVWTKVLGTSPNRRFVASWNAVPIFNATGSTLSFQIVLDEATGRITYSYRDVYAGVAGADRGSSATVGVESPGGDAGTR